MLIVKLREQKKFAVALVFSLGFFTYSVTVNSDQLSENTLVAQESVSVPHRGIASE